MNNNINICYAADNMYVMQAGISMLSVLKHNENVNFYLLCDDYTTDNIDKLKKIEKEYKCNIFFINCKKNLKILNDTVLFNDNSKMKNGLITFMYARLFVGSLLPQSIDRIIYLDCDTLVNGNLKDLYDRNVNGIFAAVRDVWPVKHNKLINFKKDDVYFNSGVLLINLDEWRKKEAENMIINHVRNLNDDYYQRDQDILNIVFKDRIDTLPLEYNMMYITRAYKPKLIQNFSDRPVSSYYDIKEIEYAKKNIKIIHFAGEFFGRPWIFMNMYKDSKLWGYYLKNSPWKDYKPILSTKKYCLKYIKYFFADLLKYIWYFRTKKRFNKSIENQLKIRKIL